METGTCPWTDELDCAVTVCDTQGVLPCHSERSRAIIARLLETGGKNVYTIEKRGVRKLIYQTVWRDESGAVRGLVEFSMEIPETMPHYIRN